MRLALTILAILYALSPFDLLPERFLPVLGWLDDLVVLWLVWRAFYAGARRWPGRSSGQPSGGNTGAAGSTGNASAGRRTDNQQNSPQKDPYSILGIAPDAGQEEIKSAYRRLAATYHPDKVAHLGEEFKKLAEERFKEIQEAYQVLKQR